MAARPLIAQTPSEFNPLPYKCSLHEVKIYNDPRLLWTISYFS